MYSAEVNIRVRYAETDQMGYVYYGNYATYFEVARTEVFRNIGISYKQMEEAGIMMPVYDLHCKYMKPAKYDDLLTVKVFIRQVPESSRIKFEYETYNEIGALLNTGETTLVFVDKITGRPVKAPANIQVALKSKFN